MDTDYNEVARSLLESRGFKCEPEPNWITKGRKPDFYCEGPLTMWVEVKSFIDPPEIDRSGLLLTDLRDRFSDLGRSTDICGKVHAWFDDDATGKDNKNLIHLLRQAVHLRWILITPKNNCVFVVPKDSDNSKMVNFRFKAAEGDDVDFIAFESKSGRYGLPILVTVTDYRQNLTVKDNSGNSVQASLLKLCTFQDDFQAGILLSPKDERLSLGLVSRAGGARYSLKCDQIRRVLSSANKQFSNAMRYKSAPSLLMIYDETIFSAERRTFLSAVCGNLAYQFNQNNFENGRLVFTQDGVFRPNKNTSTSGIARVNRDGSSFLIHNQWARFPLSKEILGGDECFPVPGEEIDLGE